ncbi:esterase/lipase family protein [Erythrobacter alti]|uniref:esterase/lipase family protein n=1 Tax=Erythrobacter alti TaxID=1896145 RepID=UPI0030F4027B
MKRLRLLRGTTPDHAHRPPLRYFFAELLSFADPVVRRLRPELSVAKADHPRVVILFPGFATGPNRMRYLATQLERAGHKVKRWGLGHNLGPTPETLDLLSARICEVCERYGQKVVLIGWSLGGVVAREVAKINPDCVAKVITMGSPFSHSPYSNNIWRPYQLVAGHTVDAPPISTEISAKPPVETVAFWSPRDGVISRRAACGEPGERDRAVALRCSHLMFPNSPDCIKALLDELQGDGNRAAS